MFEEPNLLFASLSSYGTFMESQVILCDVIELEFCSFKQLNIPWYKANGLPYPYIIDILFLDYYEHCIRERTRMEITLAQYKINISNGQIPQHTATYRQVYLRSQNWIRSQTLPKTRLIFRNVPLPLWKAA